MINSVVLVGRLTKDPEVRTTSNGNQMCSFTVAVDRRFKSPGQPEADFINCVAWGKTADLLGRYMAKGRQIGVEGRIQTRNYENQQGQRVYVTEVAVSNISFLDFRKSQQEGGWNQGAGQNGYSGGYGNGGYSQNYSNSYNNNYSNNQYQGSQSQLGPGMDAYASSNPYAAPAAKDLGGSQEDSDVLDIASDDLPF